MPQGHSHVKTHQGRRCRLRRGRRDSPEPAQKKYREPTGGTEAELIVKERSSLKQLKRENQDLKVEAIFLKKCGRLFRAGAAIVSTYE
ncbi:hypothetical protein GCM10027022_10970 [Alpinimonas psychrophila]